MTEISIYLPQQPGQGISPGRKKGRKKGGISSRLNAPASGFTSNVANGSGSGIIGVPGGNGRPRKTFQKRDLVEAVRKMGAVSSISSRRELGGEGRVWNGFGDDATRMKRVRTSTDVEGKLRVLETGLLNASRRYNESKLEADRKAIELQSLLDTLTMIKLEHDGLQRMRMRQTRESSRIGTLANQISDATEEIQSRIHYRRILLHMLRRLEHNKVPIPFAVPCVEHVNGTNPTA